METAPKTLKSGFSEEVAQTFANDIAKAIKSGKCTVLSGYGEFETDRAINKGHPNYIGVEGNSEEEASKPFDLMTVINAIGIKKPRIAVDSLRLFGSVHTADPIHFHGYAPHELKQGKGEAQLVFLKDAAPYDPKTGIIDHKNMVRNGHLMSPEMRSKMLSKDKPPVIIVVEIEGIVKRLPLNVGDVLVLPSGAKHHFSCLPGIYADISTIEIADTVHAMGKTTWEKPEYYQRVIADTIEQETGKRPSGGAAHAS